MLSGSFLWEPDPITWSRSGRIMMSSAVVYLPFNWRGVFSFQTGRIGPFKTSLPEYDSTDELFGVYPLRVERMIQLLWSWGICFVSSEDHWIGVQSLTQLECHHGRSLPCRRESGWDFLILLLKMFATLLMTLWGRVLGSSPVSPCLRSHHAGRCSPLRLSPLYWGVSLA